MKGKLLYKVIKEKRNKKDITQRQIAEELQLNLEQYREMEEGNFIPSKNDLIKICKYFNINVDDIYKANFKDTKVISVMSNKGGVGKTSITGSVAYALSELGYKVLCIDSDMQGNLTHSFDLSTDNEKNLSKAIEFELDLREFVISSEYKNLDFIVYNSELSAIDMIMFTKNAREHILKRILKGIIDDGTYDYILIDTTPSLSILNFNVINVSNYCIIPVQLGAFGLEGIDTLINFIDNAVKFNSDFKNYKLVINNYDRRKGITIQSEKWLRENYSELLFNTIIKVDTNIENAQVQNTPVLAFNSNSRISKEIRALTKEIIKVF